MITPSPAHIMPPPFRTRRRRQRGQTAVVALLVLLLLSFVGALFITIIARNLVTQGRTHRTLNADYYAEAGLRYADDQLTASLDGADWRPALQNLLADGTPATNSTTNYVTQLIGSPSSAAYYRYKAYATALNLQAVNANDPDKAYLEQGFTRYDTANGRFLLRVTYDPVHQSTAANPTARYIKIESVGREGTVISSDPTTYGNRPVTRLAATLIAYKPIAITDFARFETNIDNRSGTMNLGVPSMFTPVNPNNAPNGIVTPGTFDFTQGTTGSGGTTYSLPQYPVITTYGDPKTGAGGSFFANANVRFYGVNTFYLAASDAASNYRGDSVAVAGSILVNDYDPNAALDNSTLDTTAAPAPATGQDSAIVLNPPASGAPTLADYVAPTNSYDSVHNVGTPFDTHSSQVRDGGSGGNSSDAEGNPRSVARLDPPVIDTVNSATSLTRYQAITEASPPRANTTLYDQTATAFDSPAADANAAMDGYGQSIYINNSGDVQRDSTSLVGAHTLVDEWLNSSAGGQSATTTKGGWVGPYYNPPGTEIAFGLQRADVVTAGSPASKTFYGFRMTRSDVDATGNPVLWKDPTGSSPIGRTMTVSYRDLNASNDPAQDPGGTFSTSSPGLAAFNANPNNDVLIYAEGNVRVRGILSSDTAAPASSDRLYNDADDDDRPRHITIITNGTAYIDGSIIKGNPNSSITIMARDYVCVNTTQFQAGAADTYPGVSGGLLNFSDESEQLVQEFSFGVKPSTYPSTSPLALYVSGGAGASGSVIADFDITNPLAAPTAQGQPPSLYLGGNPFDSPIVGGSPPPLFSGLFDSTVGGGPSLVTHNTYYLTAFGALTGATIEQPFQLWARRDPGADNPTGAAPDQPFQLEHAAILPMDVRIEAVLYAQNKSFFVIPGPWFNSDTGDDLQTYNTAVQTFQTAPATAVAPTRPGINQVGTPQDADSQARFPFYGQPIDLKITIAGAVSEARPADIGAQAAWMQKWGWIPQYHGSGFLNADGTPKTTAETAGHPPVNNIPATGLTFVYDPMDGYPAVSGAYLRTDLFGRPLPITPKLPVSTGLLYSGQNPGPSLLQ